MLLFDDGHHMLLCSDQFVSNSFGHRTDLCHLFSRYGVASAAHDVCHGCLSMLGMSHRIPFLTVVNCSSLRWNFFRTFHANYKDIVVAPIAFAPKRKLFAEV